MVSRSSRSSSVSVTSIGPRANASPHHLHVSRITPGLMLESGNKNRQRRRRVMTLAASALLGLTKHSLRAADKSTIVDSGAASPEIGMTYFIMSLTSHGKTLHPSKNTIFYACYLGERWESRGSANKISGTAAFIMDSCSCIMYPVKKQLVPWHPADVLLAPWHIAQLASIKALTHTFARS